MNMETVNETLRAIDVSLHTKLAGVNRLAEARANAAWLKKRGIIHVPGHHKKPEQPKATIAISEAQKKNFERRREAQRKRHQEIYQHLKKHQGLTARQIAEALFPAEIKLPNVSARHHLMIMRDNGLVRIEKEGIKYVYYAI